jgi:hypothetical protein
MGNTLRFAVVLPVVIACSASNRTGFGGSSGSGDTSAGAGAGSSVDVGAGTGGTNLSGSGVTTSSGTGGGCTEAATFVYVLSTDNVMYSFKPDKKQFTKIGPLGCNTTMQPNSMAVDRDATAWVNYVANDGLGTDIGGAVFPVSTTNASCKGPAIAMPNGWYRLGMGFSSDGGDAETLFIAGTQSGIGLGRLDLGAKMVKPVGQFSGALSGQSAELTGTGDGRLYGFFTTFPVQVAQINKSNAAIINSKALSQVPTPQAWAFSFWGGDFYLYTSNGIAQTTVARYRPSDGTVIPNYMTNIGFIVVGAGVSTCAPIEPPK